MICFAGAEVSMSSQYNKKYIGAKAVDGKYEPVGVNELTSIAITTNEPNPWIMIDLSEAHCISAVKTWNRFMAGPGITNLILVKQQIKYNIRSFLLKIAKG